MPEQPPMPSSEDIEATLRDLLTQFSQSGAQDHDQIAQFARAGAEAILLQVQHQPWLTKAESAAVLGVSETMVQEHLHPSDHRPAIHRRDLSMYYLSRRLGTTEEEMVTIRPPVDWDDAGGASSGPRNDLTPG